MRSFYAFIIIAACLCVAAFSPLLHSQSKPSLDLLLKLSDQEFVDVSKITWVRFPTYTPECFECQSRWGAWLVVDGKELTYGVEAEVALRQLLGNPPKVGP